MLVLFQDHPTPEMLVQDHRRLHKLLLVPKCSSRIVNSKTILLPKCCSKIVSNVRQMDSNSWPRLDKPPGGAAPGPPGVLISGIVPSSSVGTAASIMSFANFMVTVFCSLHTQC